MDEIERLYNMMKHKKITRIHSLLDERCKLKKAKKNKKRK